MAPAEWVQHCISSHCIPNVQLGNWDRKQETALFVVKTRSQEMEQTPNNRPIPALGAELGG